jgi:hypothetical protein
MPISYDVDEDRNFAYVTVSGKITEDELISHASRFLSDPRIKPGYRELFDARGAATTDLSLDMIQEILELDRAHPDKLTGSRTALVIPPGPAVALAEAFERQSESTVIIFTNLDVAITWLGYDGDLCAPSAAPSSNP